MNFSIKKLHKPAESMSPYFYKVLKDNGKIITEFLAMRHPMTAFEVETCNCFQYMT
jgi:hypothetical protein